MLDFIALLHVISVIGYNVIAIVLFLRIYVFDTYLYTQAGAKHVYAVEASEMTEYARRLVVGNPSLGQRITVRYIPHCSQTLRAFLLLYAF